jgi:hypothetical protein
MMAFIERIDTRAAPLAVIGDLPEETTRSETPESATSDATFDQWLTHHLRQLYDPVVGETIPADLLRLLERRLK